MSNPFRPGAGHMPPYLAGRDAVKDEFAKYLDQDPVLQNIILTGLRGVGKTVLLETIKPIALQGGWLWVGTDLSEASGLTEQRLALRLLTDLAVATSGYEIQSEIRGVGFGAPTVPQTTAMTFEFLSDVYSRTPGLVSDKLKAVLEAVWPVLGEADVRGIVFAYDEAQVLSDHAESDEFPLSVLLDVFQSLQRKGYPHLLVLTGLPTLFQKLVEARTYAERMFHQIFLDRLDEASTDEAVRRPVAEAGGTLQLSDESVEVIYQITRGYPYFIQFVCREVFDVWIRRAAEGHELGGVQMREVVRKLDDDFFAGRWSRATDRQRDLLRVIASLQNSDAEFTVQEIVQMSKTVIEKPFSSSHVNQMLATLANAGLVYRNRWGKYSLAVPLLDEFIRRQLV